MITTVTLLGVCLWSIGAPQVQNKGKGDKGGPPAKPRILPLTREEWTDDQRPILERFSAEEQSILLAQHCEIHIDAGLGEMLLIGLLFGLTLRPAG